MHSTIPEELKGELTVRICREPVTVETGSNTDNNFVITGINEVAVSKIRSILEGESYHFYRITNKDDLLKALNEELPPFLR